MNPGIRHQISLEFCQIYIERSIEPERSCDGWYDLANKTVKVGIWRILNIKVTSTDIIDGFIVYHEGTVWVFQSCVCC